MTEDGWTREHHYFSRYPDIAGLTRDGHCYWLQSPSSEQPWWKAPFDAGATMDENPRKSAHLILGRREWAELTGSVQVRWIHIAPEHDPDVVAGLLLDPVCAWADTYGWRLDLSKDALAAGENDLSGSAMSPAFLESRGFALVEDPAFGSERWQRTPGSASSQA